VVPNWGECRLPFWVDLISKSAFQKKWEDHYVLRRRLRACSEYGAEKQLQVETSPKLKGGWISRTSPVVKEHKSPARGVDSESGGSVNASATVIIGVRVRVSDFHAHWQEAPAPRRLRRLESSSNR
jgi:hypothetical protein